MKIIEYICLSILFSFVGSFIQIKAQSNPYKIDDSLYPIYQKATKYRIYPQGLLLADTLYAEAIKINDKKAECLALTIPVIYYFNQYDKDELDRAAKKLMDISRKNNYLQYYYFACIYKVNCRLNLGESLQALQEAGVMKQQAFKDQHAYGISTCMRMLGNIYIARCDWRRALKNFQDALTYTQANLPDQDQAAIYLNISLCYRSLKYFKSAYENIEKGIKCAKTNESRISCMLEKCILLYYLGKYDEFEEYYKECMRMTKHYGKVRNVSTRQIQFFHYLLNHQYQEAHNISDSLNNLFDRVSFHYMTYLKEENYKKAYEVYCKVVSIKDSISRQIQSADLAELNVQIGNEKLKQEAQALQLENTRLNLQNTTLALEQAKAQIELEKINAENSKLQLNNRNLELAKLKVETEKQQVALKEQQLKSQHQLSMMKLEQSFFLFFVIGLILYLYSRHRSITALREKNKELLIARDQAEQAAKMKSFFVQNMSHEIRTPLNAIVGFSQVLTDPDMEMEEEEKKDCSLRIQQSSELLTTLINDILDLAGLESSRYAMNVRSTCCNELCRIAIATVSHRKPEKVHLYFTTEVEDDFMISTDGKRVEQVLINFLTNAEKNTEEGEIHLHCSVSEYPGKITFSVADTGPGIPGDKIETIFNRFEKLDTFKQGTGLGLNICKLIADHLNGEVKVDRNYTAGARFLFIHPLESER